MHAMTQRRLVTAPQSGADGTTIKIEEPPSSTKARAQEVRIPLSLDNDDGDQYIEESTPLADLDRNERRKTEQHLARVQKWKKSPFACGLTECTWQDEQTRETSTQLLPPDETGCLWCSAYVCSWIGAARVGNMSVLKQSHEWVEDIVIDEESGESVVRRYMRPRLDIVVGPYWPMLVFVTYALIFGISFWTLKSGIWGKNKPPVLIFCWFCLTCGLIVSLALTACRDPGILYRAREDPPDETWRWSDPADSYRPRNAWFDSDTAVVIEEFDHT